MQHLAGKAILFVCTAEATETYGVKHLCSGLHPGIDGGIHSMNVLWNNYGNEENWGILLVDAYNVLNDLNCMVILWHVHHIWPSGTCYLFNTYRYWKILVIRGGTNIHSKEGVTQGDPLAMLLYALGVLPIIEHLEKYCKDDDDCNCCLLLLLQVWYADESADAGYLQT
eukprot:1292717-Ditylum_brightwellii.AAC.1